MAAESCHRAGARHYQRGFDPALPPDNPAVSDEEIGVALCLGQMPDNPSFIRAAAQSLSSPRVVPACLARLAEMERVDPVFLHIAAAAERADASLEPWATLRKLLHPKATGSHRGSATLDPVCHSPGPDARRLRPAAVAQTP